MILAAIVAGGTGSRMGADRPKQFLTLGDRPLILHTIAAFADSALVDYTLVGVHPDWLPFMEEQLKLYFPGRRDILLTAGGKNRNETIRNILQMAQKRLNPPADTVVLSHDGVRPFVNNRILADNVEAVRAYGACGTAVPATDTIQKISAEGFIEAMPARETLVQAQTPQSFRLDLYRAMLAELTEEEAERATDVCRLFFEKGYPVHIVQGDVNNIKITYAEDLPIAELILKRFDKEKA